MISIIVAMDDDHLIGVDNDLPWHNAADLAHFKKTTMGKTVVMGRTTYESIGKPLPGRKNVVLTRDKSYAAQGVSLMHRFDDIFNLVGDVFVIGGTELYSQALHFADVMYVTRIHGKHPSQGRRKFFPIFNELEWEKEVIDLDVDYTIYKMTRSR